jgi:hypothetical protein
MTETKEFVLLYKKIFWESIFGSFIIPQIREVYKTALIH